MPKFRIMRSIVYPGKWRIAQAEPCKTGFTMRGSDHTTDKDGRIIFYPTVSDGFDNYRIAQAVSQFLPEPVAPQGVTAN